MRNVQIYRAVQAVSRFGSIRRAAAALSISPSALNRQIQGLEKETGVDLFERFATGVRLSAAGELYLACFRDHLSDLARVSSQIADLGGLRAGTISVGVTEDLANTFLPKAIAAYSSQFPLVDFKVTILAYDEAGPALARHEVEVAVAANPIMSDDVQVRESRPVGFVGVMRSDAARAPGMLSFSDLAQRALILPTIASGVRHAVSAAFAARRVKPRVLMETDRACASVLMAHEDAVQIVLDADLDPSLCLQQGLVALPVRPSVIAQPHVMTLELKGRALSVAAAKFGAMLSQVQGEGDFVR